MHAKNMRAGQTLGYYYVLRGTFLIYFINTNFRICDFPFDDSRASRLPLKKLYPLALDNLIPSGEIERLNIEWLLVIFCKFTDTISCTNRTTNKR
jgi:hypothetical protein